MKPEQSLVNQLISKWEDDGASRGPAFCELRDLARELEARNLDLHDLVYEKHHIAFSIDNGEIFIDGCGLLPVGTVARLEELKAKVSQLERQLAAPAELPPLSDEQILQTWDRFVSEPCEKYPLTDNDKLQFARALLAQRAAPTAQPQFCAYCHYDHSVGPLCKQAAIQRQSGAAPQEAPQEPVVHLWACSQETGREVFIRSGPRAELQEQCDRENAAGNDWFIRPISTISAKVPE